MRARLMASVMLCALFGASAWAGTARTASVNPQATPSVESEEQMQATAMLQQLNSQLEAAGYKDVQVLPSAVVVSAKDGSGKPALLLIDLQSMMALRLESPAGAPGGGDSGTTGSGSPEERDR